MICATEYFSELLWPPIYYFRLIVNGIYIWKNILGLKRFFPVITYCYFDFYDQTINLRYQENFFLLTYDDMQCAK